MIYCWDCVSIRRYRQLCSLHYDFHNNLPGFNPFPWSSKSNKLIGILHSWRDFFNAASAFITPSTSRNEVTTLETIVISFVVVSTWTDASSPSLSGHVLIKSAIAPSRVSKVWRRSCKFFAPGDGDDLRVGVIGRCEILILFDMFK